MTFSSLFLEILSIIDLPYWKWNAVFFPRDLRVSERDFPLFTSAMQLCKFRLQSFVGWKRSTDCIKKVATASTTTIYELERSFSCFGKCYGSLMLLLIERIVNLQQNWSVVSYSAIKFSRCFIFEESFSFRGSCLAYKVNVNCHTFLKSFPCNHVIYMLWSQLSYPS